MVYIRRMIWYIASRLVLLCVLLGMLVCGFFMCMNLANVYIVLDEGLQKRVEVCLTREDAESLNKYFHSDFLNADPALISAFDGTSAYEDYTISDFEYELTVESLWSWPWDDYATCTVVERVPSITGRVISSRADALVDGRPLQHHARQRRRQLEDRRHAADGGTARERREQRRRAAGRRSGRMTLPSPFARPA